MSFSCHAALRSGGLPDDADVVGRTLTIEERQATVVGVLHEDFRFHLPASPWPGFRPKAIDIYQPLFISPVREGMIGLFNVVGRLRQGVSLDQARAELEGIRNRITQEHPNPYRFEDQRRLRVVPLHDQLAGGARLALWVLLTAVAFVLLIACANVANLLLARASTRQKEIAIRVSLGAGRFRVLQQCLMESLMLALIGSALGLLIGRLAITAILRLGPQSCAKTRRVHHRRLCTRRHVRSQHADGVGLWTGACTRVVEGEPERRASGGRERRVHSTPRAFGFVGRFSAHSSR